MQQKTEKSNAKNVQEQDFMEDLSMKLGVVMCAMEVEL